MLEELDVSWEVEEDFDEKEDDTILCHFFQCDTPSLKKLLLRGVRCIPSITYDLSFACLSSRKFELELWPYPVEVLE